MLEAAMLCLGAHGNLFVDKGVHLFFHDISGLTNGTGKKLCLFQYWCPDFREVEAGKNISGTVFYLTP